jgi:hypothetical protein
MSPDEIIQEALEIFQALGPAVFQDLNTDQLTFLADQASKELSKRRVLPVLLEENEVQQIQLELIRRASFNFMDGYAIADDLEKNTHLWRAALISCSYLLQPDDSIRAQIIAFAPLLPLRDLERNVWNVDTLYILPKEDMEEDLEQLVSTWNADEIDWLPTDTISRLMGGQTHPLPVSGILRVWWD